jgi:pyridoxamine 5'-phosphate oxidase
MQNIADIRREYKLRTLDENYVADDPVRQFRMWWDEAIESRIDEVNAMTLSTSMDGIPSARIVLLKGFSEEGFVFYTNYKSNKAKELAANPNAALVFFWKELERQVRITGTVEKVTDEESDTYFSSRPTGSKAGAWASPQSSKIKDRQELEEKLREVEMKFTSDNIPRPVFWGGYIVKPVNIEFWQGRPSRLHDRILYSCIDNKWMVSRLAP